MSRYYYIGTPGDDFTEDFRDAEVMADGSTTPRTLAERAADVVNLLDNGCVCDGVTNDYAALEALRTRLGATAKTIVVPGPCKVDTAISLPANLSVQFTGSGSFIGSGLVTFRNMSWLGSTPAYPTAAPWQFSFLGGLNGGGFNEVFAQSYNWGPGDAPYSSDHPQWTDNTEARYVEGAPPNGLLEKHWNYISIDRLTRYRPLNFDVNLNTHDSNLLWRVGTYKIYSRAGGNPVFLVDTTSGNEQVSIRSTGATPFGVLGGAGDINFTLDPGRFVYGTSGLAATSGTTTRNGVGFQSIGKYWNGSASANANTYIHTRVTGNNVFSLLINAGGEWSFRNDGRLVLHNGAQVICNAGAGPETSVNAGSLYLRVDGTSPGNFGYIREFGGWAAIRTKFGFADNSASPGGTTSNVTDGRNAFTAGTATVTITNSLVATTSRVYVVLQTNDATAILKNVVPGTGSFVVNLTANCTAATTFGWMVAN